MDVSIQTARDLPEQQVRGALLASQAGASLRAVVVSRFTETVANPWSLLLAAEEEVGLSETQRAEARNRERQVDARHADTWERYADRLSDLSARRAWSDAVADQERTISAAGEIVKGERDAVRAVLTPAQFDRMPAFLRYLMTTNDLIRLRLR